LKLDALGSDVGHRELALRSPVGLSVSAANPTTITTLTIPNVRDHFVHAVALRAAILRVDVPQVCRTFFRASSITLHFRLVTSLDMNALNTVSIILFPQSCVGFEIIAVSHFASPCNFFAVFAWSCKIASDLIPRAILQHVNLAGIATTLPMVWTHPKRSGPRALAANHINVEVKLSEIVHAERAFHF
jgi:hypothetical protein